MFESSSMEKKASSKPEMGLEDDWDFLTDDVLLLEFPRQPIFSPDGIVDMNYFICPSPNFPAPKFPETSGVPPPIWVEPPAPAVAKDPDREIVKEIREVPAIKIIKPNLIGDLEISQVFFTRLKEKEFVDMKMDSPKSSSMDLRPQFEVGSIQFGEREDASEDEGLEQRTSKSTKNGDLKKKKHKKKKETASENREKGMLESGGLTIWKWRITGIGSLCSVGVAAAAMCIFVISCSQRQRQQTHTPKVRYQMYRDDERMKLVVQHATRLNQTLSGVRAPLPSANITFGGYYNGI